MARRGPREVTVAVAGLGADGLGRAAVDGRELRVRNGLPHETVCCRILKRRRGVWYGEAHNVQEAVPERVTAPCPAFPRCGGCTFQHLDYVAQLAHKSATLRSLLAAEGVTPGVFRAPVTGPRLRYRHKARLGVRLLGDEVLVGFRESFSSRVTRADRCPVLAASLDRLVAPLKRLLANLQTRARIPQLEVAAGDREAAVIVRHLDPLPDEDLGRLTAFAHAEDVQVHLQPGGYDTVTLLAPEGSTGLLRYANLDYGLCFEFHPADFTQVNPAINRMLGRAVAAALAPARHAAVADLFCGIGNFSLVLARQGIRVLGLEVDPRAVARARANAARNGVAAWCEFRTADLYDADHVVPEGFRHLLLDPPRSGAGPRLPTWLHENVERVVYVSCNPDSFARDARVLAAHGMTLAEVGVYDMFPQTAHAETLGVFVRSRR